MRIEVFNHFDNEGTLKQMPDQEQMKLLTQIEAVQNKCKKHLAELHAANKNGTLVEDTPILASLHGEINALKSKIDIIQIEKQQLEMIKEHNSKVDDFTQKFSDETALLTELKKLDVFAKDSWMPVDTTEQNQNDIINQTLFLNFEDLEENEQEMLLQRVSETTINETQDHRQSRIQHEIEEGLYLAARHGLSYAKLFHNTDGGYNMEKLKKVMKRVKQDREDGVHPFVDPKMERELDAKIRKVLKLNIGDAKPEPVKEPEEGQQLSYQEHVINSIQDDEERQIAKALANLLNERRSKEQEEDSEDEHLFDDTFSLNDKEIDELRKAYEDETGVHLNKITDAEEYKKAWVEWVTDKIPWHIRQKKQPPTILEATDA